MTSAPSGPGRRAGRRLRPGRGAQCTGRSGAGRRVGLPGRLRAIQPSDRPRGAEGTNGTAANSAAAPPPSTTTTSRGAPTPGARGASGGCRTRTSTCCTHARHPAPSRPHPAPPLPAYLPPRSTPFPPAPPPSPLPSGEPLPPSGARPSSSPSPAPHRGTPLPLRGAPHRRPRSAPQSRQWLVVCATVTRRTGPVAGGTVHPPAARWPGTEGADWKGREMRTLSTRASHRRGFPPSPTRTAGRTLDAAGSLVRAVEPGGPGGRPEVRMDCRQRQETSYDSLPVHRDSRLLDFPTLQRTTRSRPSPQCRSDLRRKGLRNTLGGPLSPYSDGPRTQWHVLGSVWTQLWDDRGSNPQ